MGFLFSLFSRKCDLIDKYIWFYEQGFEDAIDNLLDIYPEFSDELTYYNEDNKQENN